MRSTPRAPLLHRTLSGAIAESFASEPVHEALLRGLSVESAEPGTLVLSTTLDAQLAPQSCELARVLVHYEIAPDRLFSRPERYGLTFAEPASGYVVRIALQGLEPGRVYWCRLWAGGHFGPTLRVRTGSHGRRALEAARGVAAPVSASSTRAHVAELRSTRGPRADLHSGLITAQAIGFPEFPDG